MLLSVGQVEVMEVAIDKTGSAVERRLIFVDKNRDMFMTQVRVYGTARKTVKLCQYSVVFIVLCYSLLASIYDLGDISEKVCTFYDERLFLIVELLNC